MAERSFAKQVEKLRLGDGEIFRGEGILAVAKALLQSGVAYLGGYQGSPISHLIDVEDLVALLTDLGLEQVRWEDKTDASAAFFRAVMDRVRTEGWMPVGLHLLMGNDAATKFANVLRNLEAGRVRVVQAVMRRQAE